MANRVKTPLIEELRHSAKNISIEVIVLRCDGPASKTGASPHNVFVADGTAAINLCVFPETRPELIKEGDILKITEGYCSLFRNSLTLYIGKKGKLKRVGRFNKSYTEVPNMSEMSWEALEPQVGEAVKVSNLVAT
eukprot:m.134710 g.134710  ORF g.134710 m.134710 type:complete len:136 (+) comp29754_c0_seq1:202-609(+)